MLRLIILFLIFFSLNAYSLTEEIIRDTKIIDCSIDTYNDLSRTSFMILQEGHLEVRNCTIDYILSNEQSVFNVQAGSLKLLNNNIKIRSTLPVNWTGTRHTLGPSHWFIKTLGKVKLEIKKNEARSDGSYNTGFIYSTQLDNEISEAIIDQNKFIHFHGVVYLDTVLSSITNNYFYRNSFGNISIKNGKKLKIDNNEILFPGNGTSGDGITLTDIQIAMISNNKVLGGSCYGIWLSGNLWNITIEDNLISDGVTTGMAFFSDTLAKDISILNNTFINNLGSGLLLQGVMKKTLIKANIFHRNAEGENLQKKLSSELPSSISIVENIQFEEIKKSQIKDGFTHVRSLIH